MKMRRFKLMSVVCASLWLASCAENSGNNYWENEHTATVVTTRMASFDGQGQTLDGENDVTDMQACLFEGGVMTQVYKNLQLSDDGYQLQLNNHTGNLYMLANIAGAVDLEKLQAEGISETEWLKTIYRADNSGKTRSIFTGMLVLDDSKPGDAARVLTLKRGVARFDLVVNVAGDVKLHAFTLTNVAQSAYLFPQSDGVKSPATVSRRDTTQTFPTPLTHDHAGMLYVCEQKNDNMEIMIKAVFDGGEMKTLTKKLDGDLIRNAIYTVTVSKEHIDVVVKPVFEDWETGGNIELVPTSRARD